MRQVLAWKEGSKLRAGLETRLPLGSGTGTRWEAFETLPALPAARKHLKAIRGYARQVASQAAGLKESLKADYTVVVEWPSETSQIVVLRQGPSERSRTLSGVTISP